MRQDYYFDDLDIENFFIEGERESGVLPTTPGLVSTKPQGTKDSTAPKRNPLEGPVKFNANGELRDKLRAFVKSDKGKKILKIGGLVAGAGVLIAFGPEIIAALGPVMPAMKALLSKQGISAKGPADIVKKFSNTQLKMSDEEKKDPKKILQAILKFFKDAKDRRAAGTATPLDELALTTADNTIKRISDGTLSVNQAVEGEGGPEAPTKPSKTAAATGETKTGIDFKIVLIVLVAVFFLSKS